VVRNAVAARKALDDAEIDLLVLALDGAADAAGNPGAKQSIRNLADAYSTYEDAWTGITAPPTEAILADTNDLDSACGS
jgi:hypothetical protein